jgi:hypothetical protein
LVALVIAAVAWGGDTTAPLVRWITSTQANVQAGVGLGGGLGKFPCVQVMDAVPALSTAGVHAAITIPTGVTATAVHVDLTSPTYYRNITITGSGAESLSAVDIEGTKWDGTRQTESITGTGAATVQGLKPFKTVTKVIVHGVAVPNAATYTIGWGDYLGLYRPISAAADVTQIALKASAGTAWVVTAAGALPAGAAVSATNGTVLPETTITAADGYMITYNASAW